jgi:hypothetical protein
MARFGIKCGNYRVHLLALLISLSAMSGLLTAQTAASHPLLAKLAALRSKISDPMETTRPAEPAKVTIGIYALRMTGMDITKNQFSLDFYIWFRWADDSLKPYESFELTNGTINFRQLDCVRRIGNENYACVHIQATIVKAWDVRHFPLGGQAVSVNIEDDDLEADQLQYVADSSDSGVDSDFFVAGWKAEGSSSMVTTHTYKTGYGDIRHPKNHGSNFSRFVFSIQLSRIGVFYSFKIFTGLILASLVAFTIFFVRPDHRLSLTVGAIFAVVSSYAVLSAYLPEVGVLTLTDKLHMVTVAVILLSLFETAYSLHLYHHNRQDTAKKLDRLAFWIIAPIFIAANVWILTT